MKKVKTDKDEAELTKKKQRRERNKERMKE
jgi:hypothetical protein